MRRELLPLLWFSAGTLQERLQPGSPVAAVLQVSLQGAQDVGGELPPRRRRPLIGTIGMTAALFTFDQQGFGNRMYEAAVFGVFYHFTRLKSTTGMTELERDSSSGL